MKMFNVEIHTFWGHLNLDGNANSIGSQLCSGVHPTPSFQTICALILKQKLVLLTFTISPLLSFPPAGSLFFLFNLQSLPFCSGVTRWSYSWNSWRSFIFGESMSLLSHYIPGSWISWPKLRFTKDNILDMRTQTDSDSAFRTQLLNPRTDQQTDQLSNVYIQELKGTVHHTTLPTANRSGVFVWDH